VVDLKLVEARTTATTVLVAVGLYLVMALEAAGRRRGLAVTALCAALGALYVLIVTFEGTRHFFSLAIPGAWSLIAIVGGTVLAVAGLALTDERFVPDLRFRDTRASVR
jgi:cation-transporting P-type ATPase E